MPSVIPAKAGIQRRFIDWFLAFARTASGFRIKSGMTFIFVVFLSLSLVNPVWATHPEGGCEIPEADKQFISPLLPSCTYWEGRTEHPECRCREISDLIRLLINYGNFVIGSIGAIALLFFMYGGFVILLAAGSAEKVQKGKQAIVAAVIGLVIVFSAQLLVRFIIQDALRAELVPGKSLEVEPEPTQDQK